MKNEMGRTCSMCVADDLDDPGIDGKIRLKWIFQGVGCRGMDRIHVVQDRDRWLAPVNAVISL
jgi:hypothetical protein